MTESPNADPLGNIPRYVIFRGRKARVLSYDESKFEILDYHDQRHFVTRDRIIFLPEKKK
jgi:hypothetical protein